MKVYNQDKTQVLEMYDLEKGYLKPAMLKIHHEEQPEVKGVFDTKKWVENGIPKIKIITIVEPIPYRAAYDEYEKINVYIPYTEKQLAEREIAQIKAKLNAWDYKTSKYVDGDYTEAEWLVIQTQRKIWRNRINELEKVIANA